MPYEYAVVDRRGHELPTVFNTRAEAVLATLPGDRVVTRTKWQCPCCGRGECPGCQHEPSQTLSCFT